MIPTVSEDQLKEYYRYHYDTNILWRVLNKEELPRREFGFDRIGFFFTRNKSFASVEDLQEFMSIYPVKGAYIGALYLDPVHTKTHREDAFTIHDTDWVGRELIFDLDANEYDPVRTCGCEGRQVCEICWGLMQDAATLIDETLRIDFGFKELVWVFTGGRGYHCWVLDRETLSLNQEQRSGIVNYMQLIHDPLGDQRVEEIRNQKVLLRERIFRVLAEEFIMTAPLKILEEIDIKASARKTMQEKVRERRFNHIVDVLPRKVDTNTFLRHLVKYKYARIDHKVTMDTRRLIRMPGSVHYGTGLIGQYVDKPWSFFPDQARHLSEVV